MQLSKALSRPNPSSSSHPIQEETERVREVPDSQETSNPNAQAPSQEEVLPGSDNAGYVSINPVTDVEQEVGKGAEGGSTTDHPDVLKVGGLPDTEIADAAIAPASPKASQVDIPESSSVNAQIGGNPETNRALITLDPNDETPQEMPVPEDLNSNKDAADPLKLFEL